MLRAVILLQFGFRCSWRALAAVDCIRLWLEDHAPVAVRVSAAYFLNAGGRGFFQGIAIQFVHFQPLFRALAIVVARCVGRAPSDPAAQADDKSPLIWCPVVFVKTG